MNQNGLFIPSNGSPKVPIDTVIPSSLINSMDIDSVPLQNLPVLTAPGSLPEVSKLLDTRPRIMALDSIPWSCNPVYQSIISQYADTNTNFSSNPKLMNAETRDHLLGLMRQVFGRTSILFALDIEAWELNSNIVTEIGIAIYDPRDQQVSLVPSTIQIHIRIKEHLEKTNGRYVPNHARNFNGNITYIMPQAEAALFTQTLVDYYFCKIRQHGFSTYLVGHNLQGDIKWMNSIGVVFPLGYSTLDTNHLFRINHGKTNISLKKALKAVEIPYAYLHNAGNDAYYTLLLAMKICDPQARVRYSLDVYSPYSEQQQYNFMTREERRARKEEKKAQKETKRQARLEAEARGEVYVPPPNPNQTQEQEQAQLSSPNKKKKLPKGATCEAIELSSASEAASAIFG